MNNFPTSLKHSECPLHILPSYFLAKWLCLFPCGSNGLHKRRPLRIDAVRNIVSHVVLTVVDSVVARRQFPIAKPPEHRRTLKHIDVIVRSPHSKESMPN